MGDTRVLTIDARDNVMLEVARDHFGLSPAQVLTEIQWLLAETTSALARRGVDYLDLAPALVPSSKRDEAAFFFDSSQIDDSWYGYEVFERVIPLLSHRSYHSILTGDLLDNRIPQWELREEFEAALIPANPFRFQHSTQFYCVYINNLTPHMIQVLDGGLSEFRPYVGHVDCTHDSFMKRWISLCLPAQFIKAGRVVLQQHEDDLDEDANQNTIGYPFEDYGYAVRSVPSMMYGTLLSYKIERPVIAGLEVDTELALNAVSTSPSDLVGFEVEVEPQKLEYLTTYKSGSLRRAGLSGFSSNELSAVIREKLRANYIYNLRNLKQHDTVVFNMIAGFDLCRLMLSLHYKPESRTVRLVTLY